jgi:bacillithiol biosynthesis cysteine-adding enzyme BshC
VGQLSEHAPVFRTDTLPFSEIPGQTKLFLEYQQDPRALAEFYPSAVASHAQLKERVSEVLAGHKVDRRELCDALAETNREFKASEETLSNIDLLRKEDTVAVLTGQQAGLFSGPLYTVYKALSAIRMSACLKERGVSAVPVFWAAGEDHDFEEVSNAFVLDSSGGLSETIFKPHDRREGLPVADIILDDTIRENIEALFSALGTTEFTPELSKIITDAWSPGVSMNDAFCRFLCRLFWRHGLVLFSPTNPRLKRLAAPLYADAIRRSPELAEKLTQRSHRLVDAGYHAQVLIDDGYFPLFWHADDGTRHALKRTANGTVRPKDNEREFDLEELAEMALQNPERFSPGVMLRPVVQDFLLPTVCYFGGAAEIAYFAQNSEVYRILDRPVTPILHRQSFTVIEAKHGRTLRKFDLEFKDLFSGPEHLTALVVERFLNRDMAMLFADAEEKINAQLNRLDQELSQADVTLAENLAKRRHKIIYHLAALRKKFHRSQMLKDETARRQIEAMFTALLPRDALQERTLNVSYFLDRYGPNFVEWIYSACDLSNKDHTLVHL